MTSLEKEKFASTSTLLLSRTTKNGEPGSNNDKDKKTMAQSKIADELEKKLLEQSATVRSLLQQAAMLRSNLETTKTSPAKTHLKKEHRAAPNSWLNIMLGLLRRSLIDFPLLLLFVSFLVVIGIKTVHDDYYMPLYDRSTRTDDDLLEEFTYYERTCTDADLTTRSIFDMLANHTAPLSDAVQKMMLHGGVVIPQVLQPETVQNLRDYLVRRNAAVTKAEAYPVSQGKNRLSFGIDATEDPAVVQAVSEVASHPFLKPLLQSILGDEDPASAEITAITAYYKSPNQAWHADTKGDGNALKFARTYSHSYSLFMPLQDTTAAMGVTDVCPGTHYCANDLSDLCERTKLGLHLANNDTATAQRYSDSYFRAGDAALLNQHVWHRGSAHVDKTAPERIVFIMSFLARPNFGTDPRQLSRGTYFHQKWNMWGHTLTDLMNPMATMQPPMSYLRCMGLWKPAIANWGYDLIVATFMRFSNEQLEEKELYKRFIPRLHQLHFPPQLMGRVVLEEGTTQKEMWSTFIKETIYKTFDAVKSVTLYVNAAYFGFITLAALGMMILGRPGSGRWWWQTVMRWIRYYAVLLIIAIYLDYRLRSSKWATNIVSGRTLMRPFPPASILRDDEIVPITKGVTTLPQRSDVLVGTRYNAPFLGSYNHWLEFHPGNRYLHNDLIVPRTKYNAGNTGLTTEINSIRHMDPDVAFLSELQEHVVNNIYAEVTGNRNNRGRFLQQDFRTGDWRIMSTQEGKDVIREELHVAASNGWLAELRKVLDYSIAQYRFGPLRETRLARISQAILWKLRQRLLVGNLPNNDADEDDIVKNGKDPSGGPAKTSPLQVRPMVIDWNMHSALVLPVKKWERFRKSTLATTVRSKDKSKENDNLEEKHSKRHTDDDEFQVGTTVWAYFDFQDSWFPGVIESTDERHDYFTVGFDDGTIERYMERKWLRRHEPLVEGDRVEACFARKFRDCYAGTVVRVLASGDASIYFDDEEFIPVVSAQMFYVPPFQYVPPPSD